MKYLQVDKAWDELMQKANFKFFEMTYVDAISSRSGRHRNSD